MKITVLLKLLKMAVTVDCDGIASLTYQMKQVLDLILKDQLAINMNRIQLVT